MTTTYPKCPDCGGTVVPRPVLPHAKVPPAAEFVCMACNAAFRREDQQLVKLPSTPERSD
jgi:DNA-directed RNA polymerase subunit RPC12/RpoP